MPNRPPFAPRSPRVRPRRAGRRWGVAGALAALAAALTAGGPAPSPHPAPVPVSGPVTLIEYDPAGLGTSASCSYIYDNSQSFNGFYYAEQGTIQVADDLHAIAGGVLCSFIFGYYQPQTALFPAEILFYAGGPLDPRPSTVVAGPYTITGLPPGANEVRFTVYDAPVLPSDLWMAVRFTSNSAGLLLSDPVTVGVSHDFHFETPPGDYFSFGGNPRANFYMAIEAELAVPVSRSTWGLLKLRYR